MISISKNVLQKWRVHTITNVYMLCVTENIPLSFEKDLFPVSKYRCIAYLTVVIFSSDIDLSNLQKFASVNCQQFLINVILLPKLFWPTVRKNCSSDWEKLLKFEAESQEFSKFLRSLEQFIQTVKGQNNFW